METSSGDTTCSIIIPSHKIIIVSVLAWRARQNPFGLSLPRLAAVLLYTDGNGNYPFIPLLWWQSLTSLMASDLDFAHNGASCVQLPAPKYARNLIGCREEYALVYIQIGVTCTLVQAIPERLQGLSGEFR